MHEGGVGEPYQPNINIIGNKIHDQGSDKGPAKEHPGPHSGAGIEMYDMSNNLVANNEVFAVNEGISPKMKSTNVTIRNNTIYDYGTGINIMNTVDHIFIEGNVFYDDPYSNYANEPGAIAWRGGFWHTNNITIVHNTFYNIHRGLVMDGSSEGGDTYGHFFRNNIFYDADYEMEERNANPHFSSNYNIFDTITGAPLFYGGGSNLNLAQWQTYTGQEQNPILVTISDPQLFVNQASYNLHLAENSPAIDRGEFIVGYHCLLADDHGGSGLTNCRHWSGNAPDIGALEYTGPPPPDTTPPIRSNGLPAGTLPSNTTQVTLSLTTNEIARCKYATTSGINYNVMPYTFANTDSTTHSTLITGLTNNHTYIYYVKMQ